MIVWFPGAAAAEHPASGRVLRPGPNELDEPTAAVLLKLGVVRTPTAAELAAAKEAEAAEPGKDQAARASGRKERE